MRICLQCEAIAPEDAADLAAVATCPHCGSRLLHGDEVHFPVRRGEADAAHPMLGRRLGGKYRVTGVLGRGGMGTVFRAVHEVSLAAVAVKVLLPRFARRTEYRAALLAEARKAGRVVHDHCARVLDVGESDDGAIFVAMELAEGAPLADWLQEASPSPATTVEILRQIARALQAAHGQGLVHRDLSARNVMLSLRDGQPWVKVLDFGIARGGITRRDDSLSPRGEVAAFANPAYSAPEQLAGLEVDARADLYSLGVLGYEMLAGRLPVEGSTTREVTQALTQGNVQPLPRRRGVPRRLRRLLEGLLARDPAARPPSAAWVAAELESILAPRGRWLGRTAVVAALGAVALTAAAVSFRPEVFLSSRPGSALVVRSELDNAAPPQYLRPDTVTQVEFAYAGFDPRALQLEASRGGAVLLQRRLAASQPGDNRLRLAGPGWSSCVTELARHCRDGAVDLQFFVEGRPPLGHARVLFDGQSPALSLRLDGVEGGLVGGSSIWVQCEDYGGLDDRGLRLVVEPGAGGREEFALEPDLRARWVALAPLLEERFAGVADRGRVRVFLEAVDRAGNLGASEHIDLQAFDLRCPEIRGVAAPGGGRTVVHDGVRAAVRLDVGHVEPGLVAEITAPDGEAWVVTHPVEVAGALELRWERAPSAAAPPFADGEWRFRIADPAGNRSEVWVEELEFRRRAVDARLEVPSDEDAVVTAVGGLIVRAGASGRVRLHCGPLWRPTEVVLEAEGVAADPRPGHVLDAAAGGGLLQWPAADAGSHRLRVHVGSALPDDDAVEVVYFPVRVLPNPCTVRLPDTRGAHYLLTVLRSDVLVQTQDGLAPGRGWIVDPAEEGLVRAQPWAGPPGDLQALAVSDVEAVRIPLRRGLQQVGFRFVDALGREAPVIGGLGQYLEPEPGERVYLVAEFAHHDSAPGVADPEVRVEYGQPARVVVSSPLVFDPADEASLRLVVAQTPLRPIAVRTAAGGGAEIVFDVPFSLVVDAAGLSELARADYAAGQVRKDVTARLRSPAGDWDLRFDVRTSRSLLRAARLDGVADLVRMPALGSTVWIPLPAPDGVVADPVPEDLAAAQRSLFRTTPTLAVRNLPESYLMASEVTRASYEEVRLRAVGDLPRAALVHALDPLGEARVSAAGLLPHGVSEAEWRARVAAGPDRAVVGVDFYQAYTAGRLLGWLVFGDPASVRLPLGSELERAVALAGGGPESMLPSGLAWRRRHEQWARWRGTAAWPPSAEDSVDVGDAHVVGGGRFTGLQFGVREWVSDLPYGAGVLGRALLGEWLQDAQRHLEEVDRLAAGIVPPAGLAQLFDRLGVVRGLALGDTEGILTLDRRVLVPGVLRTVNVRREGRDVVGTGDDPRLREVGIRWAGGPTFLAAVRSR